jgi:carboxypeptidase Q
MRSLFVLCSIFFLTGLAIAQIPQEKFDSAAVVQIRDEGLNRSHVMEYLTYLTDVYGPRLSGSPAYMDAAKWARAQLESLGLENAHLEAWGPWGKGWTLKNYSATVMGRQNFPLISYPKAWSPTLSEVTSDLILFDAKTDSALETFKGKLKGKFVMLSDARQLEPPLEPYAERDADSTLLKLANSDGQRRGGRRFEMTAEMKQRQMMSYKKMQLCFNEGAKAILTISQGDGGDVFVGSVSYPQHPDSGYSSGIAVYDVKAPKMIPQISVGAEHYNRLVRMMQKGEHPKLELEIEAEFNKADSGYNIIAEIPGTDLKDEIVMIGGHFDSWHGGTGACDNATGSSVAMEAMRIIKTLGLKPRRTIRIGLWDAEEYGFYGSRGYITKHFAEREGGPSNRDGKIIYKPEGEKFSVYFNDDNGAGKFRGIYLQGNESCRTIFRSWLKPFNDLGASTVTVANTGGTDHQAFDGMGLPGFQFIQDELDYGSRIHHATMDVYDRVPEEDMKQAAIIMAAFAYNAAMRDEKIPRKPILPNPSSPGR